MAIMPRFGTISQCAASVLPWRGRWRSRLLAILARRAVVTVSGAASAARRTAEPSSQSRRPARCCVCATCKAS
eukprot:3869681-Prymnesium_polylepis.1